MAAHCDFIAGVFAGTHQKHAPFLSICSISSEMFIDSKMLLNFIIGACSMFISHPLDTIKTNMQSENMRFMQATRTLFRTEGVNLPKESFINL